MVDRSIISRAVSVVKEGGIIIYPTDTAFGIGCRIDNRKSVDRLFMIRKRPVTQAMPVLVRSKDMALAYFDSPSHIVRHFMETYWPGALTIVSKCKKNAIYSPICGGRKSVGLRMPNHETILDIIEGVGVPVLGPSANFHGDITPYSLQELNPELIKHVDYVVQGECSVGLASTVVDCTVTPYTIIRQGAVTLVP
jgi:L-threonylcarbamoyladenylate synthase